MTSAFSYLRVSGKGQEKGDGFERQRIAIQRYAAGNEITIVQEFSDIQTGKDEWQDRPGWAAMMTAIGDDIRTIIVEKLDRVARSMMVQELILADLTKKEVRLVSQSDDTADMTPERQLFRVILGGFAQYERQSIVLKLRGARDRKKLRTGRCEGRIPFGGADKHGAVRPGEPEALKMMRDYRNAGHTFANVAVAMNQSSYHTRTGKPWRGETIQKILTRA